ncbi:MAG: chromosomal replication initiator protein DnaA [Paludibacteraceae bacterium]|nr:chromosomal replication initiator protein DnaA [Bacteroidales bacterium]MDY4512450.1 chromosomal replication initiator protein DnaA [Paludibacteraceae bacterium]MCI7429511.1 chromosomal replication initiator protein DnaA [Bacteroidales bacterium]MDD6642260.1 chromosomal replication initiator protein DnaA [Bacteroidales bacterium]MDD6781832.1 chromosomal replication initiator protein DnaA [Bacteroidales bacterium]
MTPQELWNRCLKVIKDNISEAAYSTWFEPIVPLKYENGEFVLQVPSMFFYEYIEEKFAELLRVTLYREVGEGTKLLYRIMVDKAATTTIPAEDKTVVAERVPDKIVKSGINPFEPVVQQDIDPQLNAAYNFNTFIEGTSNKLARAAGISIANEPGKTIFNPLFLFGKSGVGKTHLVNAIGMMTKQLYPEKRVLYVSANLFQIQYTDAVRRNETNDFLNFYSNIDVLILDDIHEFMDKQGTQKTFFHIFNHLHQNGKQIIMTCDRAPGSLEGMEERLLTRFQWGLSAEIEMPDFELRKAILKSKIYKDGLEISEEVIDYIAANVTDSVRNLEGVLVSLLAHATLTDEDIDLALAEKVVGKVVAATPNVISVEKIRDMVCDYFALPLDAVMSKTRKREIATARQVAMYLSKQYTKSSLSVIGKLIGGRDHATVLHACSVVNDLMDTDKNFRMSVKELEQRLKG